MFSFLILLFFSSRKLAVWIRGRRSGRGRESNHQRQSSAHGQRVEVSLKKQRKISSRFGEMSKQCGNRSCWNRRWNKDKQEAGRAKNQIFSIRLSRPLGDFFRKKMNASHDEEHGVPLELRVFEKKRQEEPSRLASILMTLPRYFNYCSLYL